MISIWNFLSLSIRRATGVILFCFPALAYIPKGSFILDNLGKNAGQGYYKIEQEVTIQDGADSLKLKETWYIENDQSMKVRISFPVSANNITHYLNFSYSGATRSGVNGFKPQSANLEKFFFIRKADSWARYLIANQIAPENILEKRPFRKDQPYKEENYIRLTRMGGSISYSFGTPSVPGKISPGLWVEQDSFYLRKIRLLDGTEMDADQYNLHPKGLALPRYKTIRWNNNEAKVHLLSVSSISKEVFQKWNSASTISGTDIERWNPKAFSFINHNR